MSSLYPEVKARYESVGIDTDAAIDVLKLTPISMHCWQGDDVCGFENPDGDLTGGIQVTGNYPGKAKSIEELRSDFAVAARLVPGKKRLNLHASYGDYSERKADRDEIDYSNFESWVNWCKEREYGFDFNPTCFSHEKSDDGFTLSHPDKSIRDFWIEHCKRSRSIAAQVGKALKNPVVTNIWIPDGMKDTPVGRDEFRARLSDSLDEILCQNLGEYHIDAVECKLFGIGSESFVVGSHEFYMGYAIKNQTWLCLDMGHFHPTEQVADKISSIQQFVPGLLLHVSRGVRWDSDHVVLNDDATGSVMEALVQGDHLRCTKIGLDFFDASINRIAAWVIGTRATQKSLLKALLQPTQALKRFETEGDYTARLAMLENLKSLPWGIVWDEYCERMNVPGDLHWLAEVREYEKTVLSQR